ncbi:MAG: hypothetical protein GY820_21775 [Gammaproteobacteria bacterium]|nr:hypothetical protein [Gammaproteobacteria bacterium]
MAIIFFAIFAIMARKLMARMAKNGKIAKNNGENGEKFSPVWQKWRENVRHFCPICENGEKIDGKMARKKSPFSTFRHGENREKNNKWRMAMSHPEFV